MFCSNIRKDWTTIEGFKKRPDVMEFEFKFLVLGWIPDRH